VLEAELSAARAGTGARTGALAATQRESGSQSWQTGSGTSPHQWYQHMAGVRKLEMEK